MKKTLIFLGIFLFQSICFAFAQHSIESSVSQKKRNKWIQGTIKEMRKFSPDSLTPLIPLKYNSYEDWQKLYCRVIKQGLIRLPNGEWIYIRTNSSHDDKEIGDITLAIDNKKHVFKNDGHVCGGIIHFETNLLKELITTSDFFKYFVSDTDSVVWKKIQ